MNRFHARLAALLALALAAAPLAAQDDAPEAAPAPAAPTAAPAPTISVEQAYKKEFAFLSAQKRELEQRLADTRARFESERARLEREVGALESAVLASRAEAESLADELVRVEEQALNDADNAGIVAATFDQANATLGSFGEDALEAEGFAELPRDQQVERLFDSATALLGRLSQIRRESGSFYLADGSEVEGQLVHFGNIAVFGVSDQAAGALAPAGGGRFRLWPGDSADSARALAEGRTPDPLRAFVFENATTAVADPEVKTVLGEVAKGGLIGWVIVALGLVALALVILRAVFLKGAGASIGNIIDGVAPHVRSGDIDRAIAACKQHKGSAARVVTAALRNHDRDREHLEDIVSESILHESTHLNRFGTVITVIAAVAPLLGLLGTVTGMIQTFDVITEFGTSDPKLLSGGIAVALVTTQLGLAVAIPALLLGSLLNGWADRIKEDMEKAALKVINLYQDVRESAARAAA